MDQRTDWRLSNHFLPRASSLELKLFVFRPLRTLALACSACPLLLGQATEAKHILMPIEAHYSLNRPLVNWLPLSVMM
jgi:hypothetical protein